MISASPRFLTYMLGVTQIVNHQSSIINSFGTRVAAFRPAQSVLIDLQRCRMPQRVDVIGLLESGIKAEELRQRTIANNVANADSPGYRRLDVRFEELLAKAMKSSQGVDLADLEPEVYQPQTTPIRANGNDVSMEMEIGEMLKNSFRQTAFVRLLRKKFTQIEEAINIRE
jgi:flagellar basal-body rod protein FlgB